MEIETRRVISQDGTSIAFDKAGTGAAVILVNGAMSYREFSGGRPLAAALSGEFTVYEYDRRGRGKSTDTAPYAVEREIEDIEALIAEAGSSAYLFGTSSGAVLALKAAAQLGPAKVPKVALYEPPFTSGKDEAREDFARYASRIAGLIEADQRSDAVAFFLAGMLPPEMIEGMKQSPEWPIMEAVAHTLAYDNAVMGDGTVPVPAARAVTMPALVLDGGNREGEEFFHESAQALVQALPNAHYRALEGQPHGPVDPTTLAPVLAEFFAGSDG